MIELQYLQLHNGHNVFDCNLTWMHLKIKEIENGEDTCIHLFSEYHVPCKIINLIKYRLMGFKRKKWKRKKNKGSQLQSCNNTLVAKQGHAKINGMARPYTNIQHVQVPPPSLQHCIFSLLVQYCASTKVIWLRSSIHNVFSVCFALSSAIWSTDMATDQEKTYMDIYWHQTRGVENSIGCP